MGFKRTNTNHNVILLIWSFSCVFKFLIFVLSTKFSIREFFFSSAIIIIIFLELEMNSDLSSSRNSQKI